MDPLILLVVAGLLTLAGKLLELWLEYHSGLFRETNFTQIGFVVLALVLVLAAIAVSLHSAQAKHREAPNAASRQVMVEARAPQQKPQARRTQEEQKPVDAVPPANAGPGLPALQLPSAPEKPNPAPAEEPAEKQLPPQTNKERTAPERTAPAAKPPELQPEPAPRVAPPVPGFESAPENAPPQGNPTAVHTGKPHVVQPRPAIRFRYRPRTTAVHVVESDTEAFEEALSKHGFHYRSTPYYSTPRGPRWYVFHVEYRWNEATVETLQQLEAVEAELKGLADRFRLPVEVRRY